MPRTPFREGAGHYDAQVEVEEIIYSEAKLEVLPSLKGTA